MENRTTPYILQKDGKYFVFPSESAACEYLDVAQSTVASCFRSKCKCKGYELRKEIERIRDFYDQTDAVRTKFLLDAIESFRIQLDKKMDKKEKPKK